MDKDDKIIIKKRFGAIDIVIDPGQIGDHEFNFHCVTLRPHHALLGFASFFRTKKVDRKCNKTLKLGGIVVHFFSQLLINSLLCYKDDNGHTYFPTRVPYRPGQDTFSQEN